MSHLGKNALFSLVKNPVTALSTGEASSWVDMQNFEGVAFGMTLGTGTTSGTFNVQVASATSAAGTNLSGASISVAGSNDNKLAIIDVYKPHSQGRYVKATMATTGGGGTWDYGGCFAIQYEPRSKPVSSTGLLGGDVTLKVVQTT